MSSLWPSIWSPGKNEIDPFRSLGREMFDMVDRVTRQWPSLEFGQTMPALNVAETKDAIEIAAELPGMDEKDVSVTLEGHRLVIAGERKRESEHTEKDWHVSESSYGSFKRSVLLPFEPADKDIEAKFEKGMLKLTLKKPPEASQAKRTIKIEGEQQKAT